MPEVQQNVNKVRGHDGIHLTSVQQLRLYATSPTPRKVKHKVGKGQPSARSFDISDPVIDAEATTKLLIIKSDRFPPTTFNGPVCAQVLQDRHGPSLLDQVRGDQTHLKPTSEFLFCMPL